MLKACFWDDFKNVSFTKKSSNTYFVPWQLISANCSHLFHQCGIQSRAKSQGLIYTPIAQSGWPHCFVRNIIKLYEPWRLHEHLQYLLHKPLLSTWRRPCPWVSLSSPVKKEVRINQFNDMECYTFQLLKSDFQILWQYIEQLEMTTPWLLLRLCDLRNELKTSLSLLSHIWHARPEVTCKQKYE